MRSHSTAAMMVIARSTNEKAVWKTVTGIQLKDIGK